VLTTVRPLTHFIVEQAKTARAFLKAAGTNAPLQELQLEELNEHTKANELNRLLEPLRTGHDVGLLSEAGCPAVADPGANLVALAQAENIRVVPLIGPSSLLLETPYRNRAMFEAILQSCQPATRLTVATDLTLPGESVLTRTITAWKKQTPPEIERRPTVFLLLA
jgi:16S rRNA (cytidine1402-2'-O)-methyltransferase